MAENNLCKKHNKNNIHVLGCEDCVKEQSTGNKKVDEIRHLQIATKKLYEKIDEMRNNFD